MDCGGFTGSRSMLNRLSPKARERIGNVFYGAGSLVCVVYVVQATANLGALMFGYVLRFIFVRNWDQP